MEVEDILRRVLLVALTSMPEERTNRRTGDADANVVVADSSGSTHARKGEAQRKTTEPAAAAAVMREESEW